MLKVPAKDDLLLIAFSGHGVQLDSKSYFCATDASLSSPETTMVPWGVICRQLEANEKECLPVSESSVPTE